MSVTNFHSIHEPLYEMHQDLCSIHRRAEAEGIKHIAMKIAVWSDIHGNTWALTEVLRDLRTKKPDLIVNLGDSLYGPLQPKETYEILKQHDIISISGNEDRLILDNIDRKSDNSTLQYVIENLPDDALRWLQSLPRTKPLKCGVFHCHGTPQADTTYLLEHVHKGCVTVYDTATIEKSLVGIPQKIVLCGHSHVPGIVQTPERMIINPGSVGLNAYDDDHPSFHKIENFHNCSQYCLLEIDANDLRIEQIALPYDVHQAAACAANNGRNDWASWLVTGRASNLKAMS